MSVRLLLINPKFSESFWSFRWALERILPGKRALNPPLGLATLAALCPPDREVQIADRVRNKLRFLREPVYRGEYSARERVAIIARLLARGVLPGGAARLYHFLRSLPWTGPGRLPLAIRDWIAGLAMRDYVDRHFAVTHAADAAIAGKWFTSIERAIRHYLREGRVSLELRALAESAPWLKLRLKGRLDGAFFSRCGQRLERLLRHTRASVTLVVEEIEQSQLPNLQRLLRRLARYGDRVSIVLSERLRGIVAIDSSVFNLVLDEPPTGAGR